MCRCVRAGKPGGHSRRPTRGRASSTLPNGQVLVYQPQVNKWTDNQIDFRAALAIKPDSAKEETFGVIFATARTQVDKVLRTVVFENLQHHEDRLPDTAQPRRRVRCGTADCSSPRSVRTISLDRLESSLAIAGIKPPTVAVQNNPPQVIVSYSPAILVPIDGAPVLKPVPGHSRFQRVINTRALILQGGFGRCASTSTSTTAGCRVELDHRTVDAVVPAAARHGRCRACDELSKKGVVDLLDGGPKANPKPSLANGVPTIYTSQVPTELIVFKGQPDFVPIVGTQLLWASNTTSDVLINTTQQRLLRAARGSLVHGAGAGRPVDLRRQQRACPPTSRRSRRSRSPAPCCRPWRARRRRRKP